MIDWLARVAEHPDALKYASIPLVAGAVGWLTNWVAVRMTFRPLAFVGRRPFGWQGIIPSKAAKMAGIFVDSTMSRLGTLDEFFREMEPHRVADQIVHVVGPRMRELTDDVMSEHHRKLWERTPESLRERVYARVDDSLPQLVQSLMREIGSRVEELVDLKQLITERLVGDKRVLNRLFQESGEREFRFIVHSGFLFGLLFGLVQLAVWILLPAWWVLPFFGLLVGFATNWIALNIIFRPLEPRRIGPFVLQGLFLKRQREVAAVWCGIVTREIMTISAIVDNLLHGSRAEISRELIRRHIRPIVDEALGGQRAVAEAAVGVAGIARVRRSVGDKALAVATAPFDDPLFVAERARHVEGMLRRRMERLPAAEFQDLLRPCFQEDEWKLILLGAALGLVAGTAQLLFVFGGAG